MNEDIRQLYKEYITYIQLEKNYSQHTVDEYSNDLQEFFAFLSEEGIADLSEIDYPVARLYVNKLYDSGLSRRSISRKISSIRSFFKFGSAKFGYSDLSFRLLHHPKKEERLPAFFYEEELNILFESVSKDDLKSLRNKALLEILYATGMRVSELTAVRLRDLDMALGIVRVMGKGRRERYIPFGSHAEEAIEVYLQRCRPILMKQKEHDTLFVNLRGDPITVSGVRHVLSEMMKEAALDRKIYPHMIRHTFATHLLANGADMRSVQELLGHQNLSSTQVYTHVTKDHLRKTYMNTHPRA